MGAIGKIQIPAIDPDNGNQAGISIQNTLNAITTQLDALGRGSLSANYTARTEPPSSNNSNQKYSVGDIIRNSNAIVNTSIDGWNYVTIGWICTKAGSPGTWNTIDVPTTVSGLTTQTTGLMGRNRIINGACNIAQRVSFVAATGLSGYGGPDRYLASNASSAGGSFTQSQSTVTYGGVTKNAVVQTVNSAQASLTGINAWNGITQRIEGFNCHDLLGQQVTISFIFNTNVSGTYSIAIRDVGNNSYVSSFSATANTPVKVTVPIASLPTTLSVPNSTAQGLTVNIAAQNARTLATSSLNAWQAGNFIVASGTTQWSGSTNNFIAVTELQLEASPFPTAFEREAISITLEKCLRYYQTIGAGASIIYSNYAATSGVTYATTSLPTPLRLSLYSSSAGGPSASGATISLSFNYNNNSTASVRYDFSGASFFMTQVTTTAAGSGFYYFTGNVSAEL